MRQWIISLCLCLCAVCPMHAEPSDDAVLDNAVTDSITLDNVASMDSVAMVNHIISDHQYTQMLLDSIDSLNRRLNAHERKLTRYHRFWNSLIPDFARVQYAGSVGLINAGAGWAYGSHDQWETDFMIGYVPEYDAGYPFATLTLRETFVPWTKNLYRQRYSFQPLSCGIFINTVLDSDYWVNEPGKYPGSSYYRFASKIRFHVFVGQRYTYIVPEARRTLGNKVSFVWELSTCDLYVVSKFINHTLPLIDILSLSFGLKLEF